MFRSILSQSRNTLTSFNLISNYCSKPTAFPEINQVTLVGTLISDVFTLASGTKSLTVRTYDSWTESHENHNVSSRSSDDLKAGQRIYVNGSLATSSFDLEDGRTRRQILVRAARILILDDQIESENTSTNDINRVDIVANVCRSPTRLQNDSVIFQVATHFERYSGDGTTNATNFISIQAFAEDVKKMAENLKTDDKVAIEGKLTRTPHILSNGKKKFSGLIVAKGIEKVIRLRARHADDAVGHDANN